MVKIRVSLSDLGYDIVTAKFLKEQENNEKKHSKND